MHRRVPIVLLALALVRCAAHVPEPTPHPSTPHITWSIAEGEGHKEACASTKAPRCVLTLTDEQPNSRLAVFHLFLHAGTVDTKYEGTLLVGFLVGEMAHQHATKIDRIVPRGSAPINVSSTGIVKPAGTYYVDIALTAVPADGSGPAIPTKERVEVAVNPR